MSFAATTVPTISDTGSPRRRRSAAATSPFFRNFIRSASPSRPFSTFWTGPALLAKNLLSAVAVGGLERRMAPHGSEGRRPHHSEQLAELSIQAVDYGYGAAVEVVRAYGLEIAYERVGEGPPLVLVHGAGVGRPHVAAPARSPGGRVHRRRLGRAGRGPLLDVPAGFGLADYAHCLAAVIDALDSRPGARRGPFVGRHRRAGALPPPSRAGGDADPRGQLRRVEGVAARGGGAGAGRGRAQDARGEEIATTLPGCSPASPRPSSPLFSRRSPPTPPREPREGSCP